MPSLFVYNHLFVWLQMNNNVSERPHVQSDDVHTTQCAHCSTSAQIKCCCASFQFPRVRDTSFTGVTVEECKVILSGMNLVIYKAFAACIKKKTNNCYG